MLTKLVRVREAEQRTRPSELDAQKLEAHRLKAENSIVDHLEARSDFFRASEANSSDHESSDKSGESSEMAEQGRQSLMVVPVRRHTSLQVSIRRNDPLSRFSESLEDVLDTSQRQVLVLNNTHGVLQDLVEEWTTLDESSGTDRLAPEQQAESMRDYYNEIDELLSRGTLATPEGSREGLAMRDTLAMPYKPSRLKHTETHDSGYRSSSSGHRPATSGQPQLGQHSTPLGKVKSLHTMFNTQWRPLAMDFTMHPPLDRLLRRKEFLRLSEGIMTQIVLKADDIDVEGNNNARGIRRSLISEANRVMRELDSVPLEEFQVHDSSDDDTFAQHSSDPREEDYFYEKKVRERADDRDDCNDNNPPRKGEYLYKSKVRERVDDRDDWRERRSMKSEVTSHDSERLPPSRSHKKDVKKTNSTNSKQRSQRENKQDERVRRARHTAKTPSYDRDGIKRDQ